MPEKPPKPESLDDGWDTPDDEATARPASRRPSKSPTRGNTLTYEELRAAGVTTPPPEPEPKPSPKPRAGKRSWAELVADAEVAHAADEAKRTAAKRASSKPPGARRPSSRPPAARRTAQTAKPRPDKPIRGGTRPLDELRAKAPPLPPRPASTSPVRGGTRSWDDGERPATSQPVPRLGKPSPTRQGTRSIDELHPVRGGGSGNEELDELPLEGLLERMQDEPPSPKPPRAAVRGDDDDTPEIEIVGEESLDEPIDEEDEGEQEAERPRPRPRSK